MCSGGRAGGLVLQPLLHPNVLPALKHQGWSTRGSQVQPLLRHGAQAQKFVVCRTTLGSGSNETKLLASAVTPSPAWQAALGGLCV